MDFLATRTIEITNLSLDGLSARHKALAANVANADTPGYKRKDVVFEDQLSQILNTEVAKEQIRQSSGGIVFNPNSLDMMFNPDAIKPDAIEKIDPTGNGYSSFSPKTVEDKQPSIKADGNNVNIEQEMVELSKNGTKYTIVAELQGRFIKNLQDAIKGGGA